jgi:hypothetical protein
MVYHKRTTCRACGSASLRPFLELGPSPLANSFLKSPEEFAAEEKYPLDVQFCEDCSLVQILDVIDPEVLFRNYIYVTGTSDTIAAHNVRYAQTVTDVLKLGPSDLVVEVASNDGSLLKCFQKHNVRTLGVEPATNIAAMAVNGGVETINKFFDSSTAAEVRSSHGSARAVIGNNVFAHVDEPADFLAGCRDLLTDDGLVVIEVPYLGPFIENIEYDTVYHEHLCYFSVIALMRLCERVGLVIVRVDHVPVHGGSIRMYAGRLETYGEHASQVKQIAEEERGKGLNTLERYLRFAEDVRENRRALLTLLRELKSNGHTIAGYGAPAKGNTLLNYCGISTDLVDYTVDKNPMKVGMYTPGMHIPVLPASTLLAKQPDYVLILAWNFAEEIMSQQKAYRDAGGKFIVPIPMARVVN